MQKGTQTDPLGYPRLTEADRRLLERHGYILGHDAHGTEIAKRPRHLNGWGWFNHAQFEVGRLRQHLEGKARRVRAPGVKP